MNLSLTWADVRNYAIALVIFLAIDMVWLLVVAKQLYADKLGYLMAPKANLAAAFLFYLLFVVGLRAALRRFAWLGPVLRQPVRQPAA